MTSARPTLDEVFAPAERAVDEAAASGRPVLAGPWLGEVGFELLYWIPFLEWAVERQPQLAQALNVVSRGGPRSWYARLARGYCDIFDLATPEDVAARRGRRTKQVELTELEQDLAARAAQRLGLDDYFLLHPKAMYEPLLALARLDATPAYRAISRHRRFPAPPRSLPPDLLPDSYVAAKFYFSAPFPDTPENRAFAADMLRRAAGDQPVVLLNTGIALDGHEDLALELGASAISVAEHMTTSTNLAVQTEVVAGARAFVGTYGGLSYLAPFHGVPSISFYSRPDQFIRRHLELAQGVFAELDCMYVALNSRDVSALEPLARATARTS